MKTNHQKLIELLSANNELIDKIYKNPTSVHSKNIPFELYEKNIVLELGSAVDLNPFYRQFVNTVLLKADYSILFGNFDEHAKELVNLKKRYAETDDYSFIIKIKKLVHNLYVSIVMQNQQIESLLYDMENQISIELNKLIEEARLILDKVERFLYSIKKILKDLDEDLASIHNEIKEVIDDINQSIEPFLSKIGSHCTRFSDLIRISEEKKALNQKLFSLCATIIQENDSHLTEYLLENQNELIFSLNEKNQFFPYDEIDLHKMIVRIKNILSIPQPRAQKIIQRKHFESKNIIYIDEEKILNDLIENGCDDLYIFLLNHSEIRKLDDSLQTSEAFRIFLLMCINKEISMVKTEDFNNENIRRVSCH
ncbi:MAG: hypothetical protein JXK50_07430 [Campylobacterales bacterium]|nr:hypothetical protein [Campylobacterales bacterium]